MKLNKYSHLLLRITRHLMNRLSLVLWRFSDQHLVIQRLPWNLLWNFTSFFTISYLPRPKLVSVIISRLEKLEFSMMMMMMTANWIYFVELTANIFFRWRQKRGLEGTCLIQMNILHRIMKAVWWILWLCLLLTRKWKLYA
jgi:hypothetical protein